MTIPTQAPELTITTSPTESDAQLMVQLAQLSTGMNVDRGQALLYKHHQDGGLTYEQFESTYPIGSEDSIAIINVMKWHETVGTLVKQGLLDRGLILDWLWVSGAWDMCKALALHHRAETQSDSMWENFEALAASQNC
ncbi:MAG: hypothetical protein JJD92_01360 [Frankiaceae bacterium]|nr:hypothetical protein [Frankiaceae bacterium]